MKRLSILGSTGSIGRNALKIAAAFPERFSVAALTAHTSVSRLAEQIQQFKPEKAAVRDADSAAELAALLGSGSAVDILHGPEGYAEAAALASADTVLTAMVGAAGLLPTLAAIDAGKDIALANKETLVMAGDIVMRRAREKGVRILPVDSEHSAIFQCLAGNRRQDLDRILLTGSGGPFRTLAADRFERIRVEDALAHPNWEMGQKITVDSSTLMNKGLEFIEARHLFGVPAGQIEVVIHPQSIVHSMVAFVDGSVVAQLGAPDMRGAIAYALSHPERLPLKLPVPDFAEIGSLTFEAPDLARFPCLALALEASRKGGSLPAVLNAANEVAVAAFLDRQLAYTGIAAVVEETLGRCGSADAADVPAILAADALARDIAAERIRR
jgi:1-deoxy-D-xylulose-5-phosphate reductoisomerase